MTVTKHQNQDQLAAEGYQLAGRVYECGACHSPIQDFKVASGPGSGGSWRAQFRVEKSHYPSGSGETVYTRHTAQDCRDLWNERMK
jgi:hypothetical protein